MLEHFSFLFTGMVGIPACASIMGKQLTLAMRVELFLHIKSIFST